MKYILLIFITVSVFFLFIISEVNAYVRVRPYFRRNGTYVQPHFRTNPNSFRWDNWSFRGNINPFNGRKGYRWLW